MKKLVIFLASIALSSGLAMAKDEPNGTETTDAETSPGARIAAYGKVGHVIVDGQTIFISKGLTEIIMEEGSADLEDESKIQCQRVKRTGSHITLRICRTVAEIKEQADFNKDEFERRYLRQRRSTSIGGSREPGNETNIGR